MGGVKDISDKVRAAYNQEQNYLMLQNRTHSYQAQLYSAKPSRGFNYYQHRRI